jgi:hypothetical protein
MLTIPAQFDIVGHTVKVVYRDDLEDDCECVGKFVGSESRVELQSGLSAEYTQVVFWHEVMHAICEHMGMPALNKDEDSIDRLGQGVAQVLKSMKGKAKAKR